MTNNRKAKKISKFVEAALDYQDQKNYLGFQYLIDNILLLKAIQINEHINFYNIFMLLKTLLFLLLLGVPVFTSSPTLLEVDNFIRGNNLVPPASLLESYNPKEEHAVVVYKDKNSNFKFILNKDAEGKPNIIFRQQLTHFSFDPNQIVPETSSGKAQIPFIQPPIIQFEMPSRTQFNHEFLAGGLPEKPFHTFKMSPGHRRSMNNQKRPCRLNEEQVKNLLKQNLVIFKDAEITSIEKTGFDRGNGILLNIILNQNGKEYLVEAGYMPRWKRLNVIKVEQTTKIESSKAQIQPIEKEIQPKEVIPSAFKFESLIQNFVEKLLVRKQNHVQKPLLLGSQGQAEKPLLLGDQSEHGKFPIKEPPFLLGGEGEHGKFPLLGNQGENAVKREEQVKKAPFLLGGQGQHGKFPLLGRQGENPNLKEEKNDNHHVEENSEQISELVEEVIGKIKLKTK